MQIKSVKYNFMMNIILKISSFVFPLISLPYVARVLGTVGNGKVAFSISVINYFSMFAQLGIPTYGIRVCASCREDKEKLTKTVHELFIINFIFTIIAYITFFMSLFFVPKFRDEYILFIVCSSSMLLNVIGMEWLYQAIEQYQYITIRNIAFKIMSIIFMFIFIHDPSDYIIYGFLCVFSASGSYVLNFFNTKKILVHKFYFKKYCFKQHFKPILILFASSVAVTIYTSMDTVMLGFLSNDTQVAYYNLATKVKIVLASTISSLGPVLLPRISYCISNGYVELFRSYIKKSLHVVMLFSIPVTIFFYIMSENVISILGGLDFLPATNCMQIITLAIIPLAIGNIACSQILIPMKKENYTLIASVVGALINLIINAFLIPKLGAEGAAIATVIAESVVMIVQVYFSYTEMKYALKDMPYRILIIANLVSTIVLIGMQIAFKGRPMLDLLLCGMSFGLCYIFVLFLLKDELVTYYITLILKKICKYDH